LAATNHFFLQHAQHFNLLNNATVILIPISLSHSVVKIISEFLAMGLAGNLNHCLPCTERLYTQNIIRELHRAGKPTFFLKLDIAKTFDTVTWDYLLEVLENMGFGNRWRAWVLILLSTATSSVLLNDVRGRWFKHRTGPRHGVPLSPQCCSY
jgi:hypothetical protein